MSIKELENEIIKEINIVNDAEILFEMQSGKKFKFYHEQDCCESVTIKSIEGSVKELIGKTVRLCEYTLEEREETGIAEYCTNTHITLKTDDNTVIFKWIGTSNGYYSESVHFREL